MTWDCPKCKEEGCVEQLGAAEYAECQQCGALFWIDFDCELDGDHWQDCSTLGEEVSQ